MTEDQYRELVKSNEQCQHGINELKTQQALIIRLLNGSPDEDISGVRPRLMLVERRITGIPEDLVSRVSRLEVELDAEKERRTNLEQRWIGIKWFLGGLGVTSVLSALTLARLLFGGP